MSIGSMPQPVRDLLNQAFSISSGGMFGFDSSAVNELIGRWYHEQGYFELHERIRRNPESMDAALLNAGPHVVARVFQPGVSDADVEDYIFQDSSSVSIPDVGFIGGLEILGQLNIQKAADAITKRSKYRDLKLLAEEWPRASTDRQREICLEVSGSFKHRILDVEELDSDSPHWFVDLQNQPIERIFPTRFIGNNSVEPNCLGKGIFMAAFFTLAGAYHLGISPFITADEVFIQGHESVLDQAARLAKMLDIETTDAFKELLAKYEEDFPDPRPLSFHLGVVVKLKDRSWFLLDPNMGVAAPLSNSSEMDKVNRGVRNAEVLHPGISCPYMDTQANSVRQRHKAEKAFEDVANKLTALKIEWDDTWQNPRASAHLLVEHGILEILLKEYQGYEHRELLLPAIEGEIEALNKLLVAMPELAKCVNEGDSLAADWPKRLNIMMAVNMFCEPFEMDIFSADLSDSERDSKICEGMDIIFGRLISIAYRRAMLVYFDWKEGYHKEAHPGMDVFSPEFRIGVELIAHMNAVGKQSNDVIMALAGVCSGHIHLMLAAGESLRLDEVEPSPLASTSLALLKDGPTTSPDAKILLEKLAERKTSPQETA